MQNNKLKSVPEVDALLKVQQAVVYRPINNSFTPLLPLISEVWPEGDVFGSAEVESEDELNLLKQILFAELPSKFVSKQTIYF